MKTLGSVKEIWRYPVKGMAGEKIQQCSITASGLAGDRTWAVYDVKRQEIQSCKFRPELLMCKATSRENITDSHVDITFPDGTTLGSDNPTIHDKLSSLVGHASTLKFLESDQELSFFHRYKGAKQGWLEELKDTFTREDNEPFPDFSSLPPEVEQYVTLPGSFYLVSPFHIITTATLNYLKHKQPEADWSIPRFRPNLVVDTGPDIIELIEQKWINKQIKIGHSSIDCTATAPRCGAVTRRQKDIPFDKSMLRTIVKEAEQNLGIYGSIVAEGVIRVGDPLKNA